MLIFVKVCLNQVNIVIAEGAVSVVWVCNLGQPAYKIVRVAGHVAVGSCVCLYFVVPVVRISLDREYAARVTTRIVLDCCLSTESVEVGSSEVALLALNVDAVLRVAVESVDC